VSSPLLSTDGAKGDLVADHYGNPLVESQEFSTGESWVDCSDWGVVRVSGPDRLLWLDSLSSQSLSHLEPGVTTESLILDPQGHIEHRFLITDDGASSWLLTEPGSSQALIEWLVKMRFGMQVEASDVSAEYAVLASTRPPVDTSGPVWVDPWPNIGDGSVGYGPEPHPGEGSAVTFWMVPRESLTLDIAQSWAGSWALKAHLIATGRPMLADVDAKSLPHEWDWLRTAVHLNKGCYRGQETVAKIHNLGHPPRRSVLFHLDGSTGLLPESGAAVRAGGTVLGYVSRSARHYEWGPIGIGLVKRSIAVEDVTVEVGEDVTIARMETLTSPTAGGTRREALRRPVVAVHGN